MTTTGDFSAVSILYVDRISPTGRAPALAPLSHAYHPPGSRYLCAVGPSPQCFDSTIRSTEGAYCPRCCRFSEVATATQTPGKKCLCAGCPVCGSFLAAAADGTLRCGYCRWEDGGGGDGGPNSGGDDGLKEAFEGLVQNLRGGNGSRSDAVPAEEEHWDLAALERRLDDGARALRGASDAPPAADPPPPASAAPPPSPTDLRPVPVPILPRRGLRCRLQYEQMSRPGILVRPALNVLEGDSMGAGVMDHSGPWRSLVGRPPASGSAGGGGGWFKKDASAAHVVPRITLAGIRGDRGRPSLLLCLRNPTLGDVRLRLRSGLSPCVRSEGSGTKGAAAGAPGADAEAAAVRALYGSIRGICGPDVRVLGAAPSAGAASGLARLGPAEDASFADISGPQPDRGALEEAWGDGGGGETSFGEPVCREDCAWISVDVAVHDADGEGTGEAGRLALPLTLQVQVGEGSWEASLVRPLRAGERGEDCGDDDFVSFAFVVVF